MFDAMLNELEIDLRTALGTCVTGLVATARARLEGAHADLVNERIQGLVEVADERVKALAEVDARRAELRCEVAAMHKHTEAQEGRVELNIGGYRFETSVQTLRRMPHTFFDAYFSGRYAQDVCTDGSIFVDRDGEHFGHILEYMRDGVVAVAEAGAHPSVSLLRALKREFGFYCIELCAEEPVEPAQPEVAFVMGGHMYDDVHGNALSTMERYDVLSGQWSAVTAMSTRRRNISACAVMGEIYVTGGEDEDDYPLSSVEKYSPSSDTWSVVSSLPEPRSDHAAVALESTLYVLGGIEGVDPASGVTASVLKLDSVQGIWNAVAPMPEPRFDDASCVVGSEIYVFGGCHEQESVFKYDTRVNEWSTLAPMPISDHGMSAIELGGLIYIVGVGDTSSGVLRYDPVLGVWSNLASLTYDCHHGASFVLGGCLYAAGGEGSESKVQRYGVTTDAWTEVADMLEGRYAFSAVTIESTGLAEEQDLFDTLIAKAVSYERKALVPSGRVWCTPWREEGR
jgi:hypothetical protein